MVLQCIPKIQSLPIISFTITRETEQMTPKNKKETVCKKNKAVIHETSERKKFFETTEWKPFLYDVVGLSNAFKHTVVAILILMV